MVVLTKEGAGVTTVVLCLHSLQTCVDTDMSLDSLWTQLKLPVHLLLLSSHLSFCKVYPLPPAVTSFLALNKSSSRVRISSLMLPKQDSALKPKSDRSSSKDLQVLVSF